MEEIRENPYFQYFIGLPGYQDKVPFAPSLLVEFRKRLTAEVLEEINEMIIDYNTPNNPPPTGGGEHSVDTDEADDTNAGTLILDATCAPQNISYPQDVNLLNEAREDLEKMIDIICYEQNYLKPRMYRQNARKDYLNLAKCRKRTSKKIRKAIKAQLQYIRRDLKYIDNTDRIEVERAFSLAKRKYGLGLLTTKLDTTTRSAIALSIIAMNVNRLTVVSFAQICISVFSRYKQCIALKKYIQNKPYELLKVC